MTHYSNLTVLMVLNGEPGWVCLMCCNSDGTFNFIDAQKIRANAIQFSSQLSLFNGSPPVTVPVPPVNPFQLPSTTATSADDHH